MTSHQFAERYSRYLPAIRKMARALWASEDDAEDAIARVRHKMLRRVGDVRSDGFISLWRVALQNDAISYLRKRKETVTLTEAMDVRDAAADLVDMGFSPSVLAALWVLTDAERYVVVCYTASGMTLAQIAQTLGVARQYVSELWQNARAKLILELKDYARYYRRLTDEDIADSVEWALRRLNRAPAGTESKG